MTGGQLALPFRHRPDDPRDGFLPAASNAAARHWLARIETWPDLRLVLWGASGCGKTHLAHLWSNDGLVLDATTLRDPGTPRAASRIVIDNADRMADETTLLHVLNTAAEATRPVLLIGRSAPAHWVLHLPDLASRLRAAPSVGIEAAEDDLLRALLARLLAERQLQVTDAVQNWLLLRLPRTGGALQDAVARLDALSLARGQPITRPLAQHGLADLLGADTETGDDIFDTGPSA